MFTKYDIRNIKLAAMIMNENFNMSIMVFWVMMPHGYENLKSQIFTQCFCVLCNSS